MIGWGLWTFNDVPKAYDDLMIVGIDEVDHSCVRMLIPHVSTNIQDIKNAKDFLGSKGVQID